MKPSLQLLTTIDATNNIIEVDVATVITSITITNGTYYSGHDGDIVNSLPAIIQKVMNDAPIASKFQVGITEGGRYYIKSDLSFKLSATANSVYSTIGFTTDQLNPALGAFSFTANEQYQNGWVADDDASLNGDIESMNIIVPVVEQRVGVTGYVTTAYYGIRQSKEIELQWLSKKKTFNIDGTYGVYNGDDTQINEALELFYKQAIKGNRFRYYRDVAPPALYKGTVGSSNIGSGTGTDAILLTDVDSAWTAGEWANHVVELSHSAKASEIGYRGILTNNDTTSLMKTGGWQGFTPTGSTINYVIYDLRYDIYVLDASTRWSPELMFANVRQEDIVYKQKFILRKYI